jgi:serine protease
LIRTARAAPYAVPDESGHDPIYGHGIIDPVPALEELLGLTGGTGGAGGAGVGGAGGDATTGQGGVAPIDAEAEGDSGCSCAMPGRGPRPLGALAAVSAAAWLAVRRRRRGPA